VVKKNLVLVNYFALTVSGMKPCQIGARITRLRMDCSRTQKAGGIPGSVCLGVQAHEKGFQKCAEDLANPLVDTPSIGADKAAIIADRDHFCSNGFLIELLNPILKAVAWLESDSASVGDVWPTIIRTSFSSTCGCQTIG
jgi:hypothetical protein